MGWWLQVKVRIELTNNGPNIREVWQREVSGARAAHPHSKIDGSCTEAPH